MGVGENSQSLGLMKQKGIVLLEQWEKVYLAVIISWYCWHGVSGYVK